MSAPDRLTRVNELIKRAVAEHLGKELLVNHVLVSVTEVNTSVDIHNATVYISVFGGSAQERQDAFHEVEKMRAQLQKELGRELKFKNTPILLFRRDERMEKGDRVLEILNEAENQEK